MLTISVIASHVMTVTEAISGTVKGKVLDQNNQPVEFATATLVDPETQKIVKGEVSNSKGEFVINKVNKGDYLLIIRYGR